MQIRHLLAPLITGVAAILIAPTCLGQLAVYEQNFDGLDASDPDALGLVGDGWRVFGTVFDGDPGNPPNGNVKFGYGPFSAPNGGPGFSAIAMGEGQGGEADQYINAYSDYNCCGPGVTDEGHFDPSAPFDRVQSTVFQEQTIGAADIGSTWYFSFDAKQPSSDGCSTTATSTCVAFFKTVDPNAGFATTNFITFDARPVSSGAWSSHVLQIDLTDPALEGQLLQFGFESVSEQFGNTGIYYDNLSFSMEPPPMEEISVGDVTGVADMSGDAVPDLGYLTEKDSRPLVRYYSGANGKKIKGVSYLGTPWTGIAAATVGDANRNGVSDDPAVAVLATRPSDRKHVVEVRRANNGSRIAKVFFFSPNWTVIDVAIIEDENGDGVTGDTLIAVLGINPEKPLAEQLKVQVKRLSDGSTVANWLFFNGNWVPRALVAVPRLGQTPLLGVLGNRRSDGTNAIQARRLSNGKLQRTTAFWTTEWEARDVTLLLDSNGDGTADDPAYVVLAYQAGTGRNKMQARRASDGARLNNIFLLGSNWESQRLTRTGDISGNLWEEIAGLAEKLTDGTIIIQLKDYNQETTTESIFP